MDIIDSVLFSHRFSHSPLIDEDDDEEEAKEPMLNEAFGIIALLSIARSVKGYLRVACF